MCSISHDNKAIFFHIGKTAGIYIRNTLSKYYNFNLYLLKRPDHIEYCNSNIELNKQLSFCCKEGIVKYYKTSEYINDFTDMNDCKWKEYFKFCFVRNPYDRAVSGWNYLMEVQKLNIDFDKYLKMKNIVSENEYWHVFLSQYQTILDENGNIFVDYIGKFENIENDFQIILQKIGFNKIKHTPTFYNRRKNDNYKKYYTQEALDIINTIYENDFIYFNYIKYDKLEDFLNASEN